jgi:hypothetical protein
MKLPVLYSFCIYCLLISSFGYSQNLSENDWINLFNGKNLQGWRQLNGQAEYKIEKDEIVGISKANTPNSFLCTEKTYRDFILEFEVKVDPQLNSGVQIRSQSKTDYQNGRVHGYQVEIDPSLRAYSGGLYDEARRGWLYLLANNPKGRVAFQNGQWNKYHVEAIGNQVRIWVNGIQCTEFVDEIVEEGFIALQVHSIGQAELAGKEIRWRNIRLKIQNLETSRWVADPQVSEISYLQNQLSETEKRKGWRLLWDGKTTQGWRSFKSNQFPDKGWQIQEGVLMVQKSGGGESAFGGDIITTEKFSNFELVLDFKITEGANSGIKYFVDPELNKGSGSAIGLEFQILDDAKHPDAKMGVNGNRTLGSLYDLIPSENLSVINGRKTFKGIGAWNRARIVVRSNKIEHWLNEEKVVEFDRSSQMYRALVANSKYKVWPNFGQAPEGHILLQDHGDEVHFKNIKIREF